MEAQEALQYLAQVTQPAEIRGPLDRGHYVRTEQALQVLAVTVLKVSELELEVAGLRPAPEAGTDASTKDA